MASEDMGLVSAAQQHNNGLNPPHSQLLFPDSFPCGPPPPHAQQRRIPTAVAVGIGDPGPKTTRELTSGFIDNHQHHPYFHSHHHQHQQSTTAADFRRSIFADDSRRDNSQNNWNSSRTSATTPSGGDGSNDEDDEDGIDEEDDDEDDDDDDNDVRSLVTISNTNSNNNKDKIETNTNTNSSDKMGNQKSKQLSSFGLNEGENESGGERNEVTVVGDADGVMYYSHYMQGTSGRHKDMAVMENGCGFSGRKEGSCMGESESLRAILSDPLTGALMDDAVILPCGHSFSSSGIQHILRMKACYTCSQAVSETSVAPNLSLRAAVQAFRREEEQHINRASKKRRERYEQDKGTYCDPMFTDHPRGRGVQFPFAVMDRVIIKGNKRTPQRFVGREAVVTTQCLNGWYVVKTLDNAESVKLQYRSLAKVSDNPSLKPASSSKMTPNWL